MDIDLLSKMVKELILDNERVVLPGLGSFVAEIVPATFSDKGYTINPPYRKLYFRSKPDEGSDLIPFYAKSNSVSEEIAEKVIVDFVTELKAVLFQKKTVIFPGLGRLRATKENNVFFVADEDLDIYPEGFGLEPISLKTHAATAVEVKAAVSDLKSILTEPVVEPTVQETTVEPAELDVPAVQESAVQESAAQEPIKQEPASEPASVAEPASEPEETVEQTEVVAEVVVEPVAPEEIPEDTPEEVVEEAPEVVEEIVIVPIEDLPVAEPEDEPQQETPAAPVKKTSFWKVLLKVLMWIVIAAAIICAAYVAVGHLCPEWLDQFLYTPEELEILNYR